MFCTGMSRLSAAHVQAMPINPGDMAECRLGGATGEEHQAPPFVPGQDGVGLVLKARPLLNAPTYAPGSKKVQAKVPGRVRKAVTF